MEREHSIQSYKGAAIWADFAWIRILERKQDNFEIEKEEFNAFIDMMAQLIQKYGNRILNDIADGTEKEKNNEQRR